MTPSYSRGEVAEAMVALKDLAEILGNQCAQVAELVDPIVSLLEESGAHVAAQAEALAAIKHLGLASIRLKKFLAFQHDGRSDDEAEITD